MNVITPIQKHGPVDIPNDILDDLASRFLVNLPPDEKTNMVRSIKLSENVNYES